MLGIDWKAGFFGLLVGAQGANAGASTGAEEAQILAQSNRWMTAMDRQDRAVLEEITGTGYQLHLLYGDRGDTTSRRDWIDGALKRRWRHNGYEDVNIIVRGDQAIMLSNLNFAPPANGILKPAVNTSGAIVDVWEKQAGEWKVVGRYAGRWRFFEWVDRFLGFALGGLLFGMIGWRFGQRKRAPQPRS